MIRVYIFHFRVLNKGNANYFVECAFWSIIRKLDKISHYDEGMMVH